LRGPLRVALKHEFPRNVKRRRAHALIGSARDMGVAKFRELGAVAGRPRQSKSNSSPSFCGQSNKEFIVQR
jgi:hypothetical protein